eukprot:scaffold7730_cov110-Isochrysis_galbana.AAC.4
MGVSLLLERAERPPGGASYVATRWLTRYLRTRNIRDDCCSCEQQGAQCAVRPCLMLVRLCANQRPQDTRLASVVGSGIGQQSESITAISHWPCNTRAYGETASLPPYIIALLQFRCLLGAVGRLREKLARSVTLTHFSHTRTNSDWSRGCGDAIVHPPTGRVET